jgi:hypothetical protein
LLIGSARATRRLDGIFSVVRQCRAPARDDDLGHITDPKRR